jgi:hypothetical protein
MNGDRFNDPYFFDREVTTFEKAREINTPIQG